MSAVDDIKKLRERYMVAQDACDADGCVSFWDDDCVLMPPSEPAVVGIEAGLAWHKSTFAESRIDFTVAFDEIEVVGDWSFARGSYKGAIIPNEGGEPIQVIGKYLEIHRRQPDGSWKFARHMWNSDR